MVVLANFRNATFAILAAVLACTSAQAHEVRLDVLSQPVTEVVDTLSELTGIPVRKAGDIPGQLENWSVDADGLAAFQKLGAASNLFIAFDGVHVIVASEESIETTAFESDMHDWHSLKQSLENFFPVLPKKAVEYNESTGMVVVRGPASLNQTVQDILSRPVSSKVTVIKSGSLRVLDLHTR